MKNAAKNVRVLPRLKAQGKLKRQVDASAKSLAKESIELPVQTATDGPRELTKQGMERALMSEPAIDLFNSQGVHIAYAQNNALFQPDGTRVGSFTDAEQVFFNRDGNYIGEIYLGEYLLRNDNSPHRGRHFPSIGWGGRPGVRHAANRRRISLPPGWSNVILLARAA
jgi:hypothetical protein